MHTALQRSQTESIVVLTYLVLRRPDCCAASTCEQTQSSLPAQCKDCTAEAVQVGLQAAMVATGEEPAVDVEAASVAVLMEVVQAEAFWAEAEMVGEVREVVG